MKKMRTREAVIATVFPALAVLVTSAAIGLLWPLLGAWCLFFALFPVAVVLTVHPVYRLVVRPRRIRRYLRKLGVPAHREWKEALEFERSSNRDFTSWGNALLILTLHKNYSGYPWMWDMYAQWEKYDLGADWDQFFSKVLRFIPSTGYGRDDTKLPKAEPIVKAIAEGKTNVVEVSRLLGEGLPYEAILLVAVEGMPVDYAREL